MARYSFGEAIEDDDILDIQGVEYKMMPLGMRAMRRMLDIRSITAPNGDDEALGRARMEAAIDMIVECVRPDERDRLRAHIEESVTPSMIVQISAAIAKEISDLDPTLLASFSPGSSPDGSSSTATAPPVASTRSI